MIQQFANSPVIVFVVDRNDPEYHKLGLMHESHGTSWHDAGCTAYFNGANGAYYRVYKDTQVMCVYPDDTRYPDLEHMMLQHAV